MTDRFRIALAQLNPVMGWGATGEAGQIDPVDRFERRTPRAPSERPGRPRMRYAKHRSWL